MKYIRTKEHIYKRLFIDRAIINECGYGNCDKELNPIGETIIKQADTIKELCDGIIVEENGNENNWFIMSIEEFKREKEHLANWTYNAFIKTYKGLIYVAKMNEKGELELL